MRLDGATIDEAQESREQRVVDHFDRELETMLEVYNYQAVSPEAKHKLRGILNHYRKSAHPFTECVRDNRKRFGSRAENVCAVVKDLIRGTTKWRGKEHMSEIQSLLDQLSEDDIIKLSEVAS